MSNYTFKWTIFEVAKTKRDCGCLFGSMAKDDWYNYCTSQSTDITKVAVSRKNQVTLSCNVMLLEYQDRRILVDAGPPYHPEIAEDDEADPVDATPNRLTAVLREHDLVPNEITDILITSRDRDHAGGLIYKDKAGVSKIKFPNAHHYCHMGSHVRRRPNPIPQADLALDMLDEAGKIEWIPEKTEIFPGITMIPTDGPSAFSAALQVTLGGDRILAPSDLCPTMWHMNASTISSYDDNPETTFSEKDELLSTAIKEGYCFAFSHGNKPKAGWQEERKQGNSFKVYA